MKTKNKEPPGYGRPKMVFDALSKRIECLLKLLPRVAAQRPDVPSSGNEVHVLRTAKLCLALARLGKRASAADAIDIAERLDNLSQLLDRQVDELLGDLGKARE